jgi:tRNA threonylcarbamoyladenosine biosynthesis protein TsaB
MKLLAIETSGETCSAALLIGDALSATLEYAPRRHGELILVMMERLLSEAGLAPNALDVVAFGRGPGSFTGVRIAAAVAQGVAFGADIGVMGVSTLTALAQGHHRATGHARILAALDARMGEVYWGVCRVGADGLVGSVAEELVVSPGAVVRPDTDGWYGVGSGFAAYAAELGAVLGTTLAGTDPGRVCEASDIALLAASAWRRGEAMAPELAIPVYLRDQVTQVGAGST